MGSRRFSKEQVAQVPMLSLLPAVVAVVEVACRQPLADRVRLEEPQQEVMAGAYVLDPVLQAMGLGEKAERCSPATARMDSPGRTAAQGVHPALPLEERGALDTAAEAGRAEVRTAEAQVAPLQTVLLLSVMLSIHLREAQAALEEIPWSLLRLGHRAPSC